MSKTLAIIKPDAVKNRNQGKIIDSILKPGGRFKHFNIVRMKQIVMSMDEAKEFYKEHEDRPFFESLCEFMTSGPCIVMVLGSFNDPVQEWREFIGNTNPAKALPGTIRADFGTSIDCNAVHGSDSEEAAEREILFFFDESALSGRG